MAYEYKVEMIFNDINLEVFLSEKSMSEGFELVEINNIGNCREVIMKRKSYKDSLVENFIEAVKEIKKIRLSK